MLTKKSLI